VLTMERAVANVQQFTGVGLETAVGLASRNPAQMMGMEGLGEIAVGSHADFNVYSGDGKLIRTMLRGRVVSDLAS
jgi:N-acetylglucosamine-6-phosphate deacetylase